MANAFSFSTPAAGSPFTSRQQSSQASSSSQHLFATLGTGKQTNAPNGHGNTSSSHRNEEDGEGSTTYLDPVAYPRNGKAKWRESGRTVGVAVSPAGGELAAWITKKPSSDPNKPSTLNPAALALPDRTVYFASAHQFPDAVLEFYAETYTFFTSLQRIVATAFKFNEPEPGIAWDEKLRNAEINRLIGPPGAETVGHMARLVDLYLEEVSKVRRSESVESSIRGRFEAVFHTLHLAKILYLPRDGRGEGLLGEELLDWVNDDDPAPDNALGNQIMQSNPPWENSGFWPYLSQCLLRGFHLPASTFLRSLSNHPHQPISKLASLLSSHLSLLPRSHDTNAYPLDHQFLTAHQQWLMRFRAELATFTSGKRSGWFDDGSGAGKWAGWENDFKVVIDLMQGKADRVLEEASDWREALGAWGILVDVGLRRDDLPITATRILDRIPVDSTVLDDTVQSSLCTGDIVKALTGCHDLDIWLAAHLADIFDKLAMIPDEDRFELSIRDYFLLDYTDLLSGHPKHQTTWSLVADYLHSAGEEGRRRLKEYIVHVGIGSDRIPKSDGSGAHAEGDEAMDVEEGAIDPKFRHLAEIREVCINYDLSEEWKTISRVVADRLTREGDLGIAATMFVQADDTYGLSRLAEKILDSYVLQGEDAFLNSVASLPPTLLNDAPATLSGEIKPVDLNGTFNEPVHPPPYTARLAFLAQFRDFILFRQQGAKDRAADRLVSLLGSDFAPIGFRAILLNESIQPLEDPELLISSDSTFELMRVLEDIRANATFAPEEYLAQLQSLLRRIDGSGQGNDEGNVDLALSKLDEVRLALARNLARALVVNIAEPF